MANTKIPIGPYEEQRILASYPTCARCNEKISHIGWRRRPDGMMAEIQLECFCGRKILQAPLHCSGPEEFLEVINRQLVTCPVCDGKYFPMGEDPQQEIGDHIAREHLRIRPKSDRKANVIAKAIIDMQGKNPQTKPSAKIFSNELQSYVINRYLDINKRVT